MMMMMMIKRIKNIQVYIQPFNGIGQQMETTEGEEVRKIKSVVKKPEEFIIFINLFAAFTHTAAPTVISNTPI